MNREMAKQIEATLELNCRAADRIDNANGTCQIVSGLGEVSIGGINYQIQVIYAPPSFHVPSDIVTIRKEEPGGIVMAMNVKM